MRISTSAIYDANVAMLNQQQSKLLNTQQQLATGRRILVPADDPAGAARILEVTQSDAGNTQYSRNLDAAQGSLSLSEGILQAVTTLLQGIQITAVNAGNTATLSNADRRMLAGDLQGHLDELTGLANSTDGLGNYLFSGFQGRTQPFISTAAGVQYMGDDGQRLVQGSASRQLAASDSGADIFMRIKNGNGTFVTQARTVPQNTGSGIISQGRVTDPALLTGNSYRVTFTGAATYDVTNTTTAAVLSTGNAYVRGQAISVDGMQFDISGAPANGDQFAITPSSNESIFKTISDLINALNTPVVAGNAASSTQLTSGLNHALNSLDRSLDNVLTVRASLGARMRELDSLKTAGDDLGFRYKQTLSQLQDVDYNKAISDLTQQQTSLQAAQKSFKFVSDLSLFNYI